MAAGLSVAVVDVPWCGACAGLLMAEGVQVRTPESVAVWVESRSRPLLLIHGSSVSSVAAQLGDLGGLNSALVTVLVLDEDGPSAVGSALAAGACGVLGADASGAEMVETLRLAAQGRVGVLPAPVRAALRGAVRPGPPVRLEEWDQQLLRGLAEGKDTGRLALDVRMEERTLQRQLRRLYARMGVANRAQAINAAAHWGVTKPPAGVRGGPVGLA